MKRNPDLIREILFKIEEHQDTECELTDKDLTKTASEEEVLYHVELLIEAGLIKAEMANDITGREVACIDRLTWEGHNFVEAARNNTNWQKAKTIMAKTGGFVLELTKPLLLELLKQQIQLT